MGQGVSRDRDGTGRPRNARPRDELGRPLARTDRATAGADPPALPPLDALREAQRLLDAGRSFTAHEVLEAVWKATPDPQRALWRGLAQLAVGLTHQARGNRRGSRALFLRAADTLAPFTDAPHRLPVDELRRWAVAAADDPAGAGPMPRIADQAADDLA